MKQKNDINWQMKFKLSVAIGKAMVDAGIPLDIVVSLLLDSRGNFLLREVKNV